MTVATLTLLASAGEPDFQLTRHTIDGGGMMRSLAGDYELSSTIGQPDAGVMFGGDFELSGGFWFGLSSGDCNDDGLVSLLDHRAFVSCLLGPGGGRVTASCLCLDVDHDETITLNDYAKLQAEFSGP